MRMRNLLLGISVIASLSALAENPVTTDPTTTEPPAAQKKTAQQVATSAPKPYEAEYSADMSGLPVSGSAVRKLQKEGDDWSLSFEASTVLLSMKQESKFTVDSKGQIKPSLYTDKRNVFGKSKIEQINFDWKQNEAHSRRDDKEYKFALEPGVLDDISYQLQLRIDVEKGRKDLSYRVADRKKLDTESFIIEGEETLDTPLGKLATVRVKLVRENKKRQTWIWLARDWNYLLVQLRQLEKEDEFLIKVKQASLDGQKVTGLPKATVSPEAARAKG